MNKGCPSRYWGTKQQKTQTVQQDGRRQGRVGSLHSSIISPLRGKATVSAEDRTVIFQGSIFNLLV